ncbi:amidase [bacterium]|nr:amidase [bacterium]
MTDLHFQSTCEIAKAIQNKSVQSSEMLELYKERIERLNPDINAIVTTDFDAALEEAHKADKELAKGNLRGQLHGVPISIKDNLEVSGMTCTAGSTDFKGYIPRKNADIVASLVKAGAIVFAKTNLPRFAEDFQTYNELFGQTNNPWDLTKTPGGSSGGSAAAVAAGMTTFDMGNDIGGSIRHPSNFCGVFGHKPSYGIVPDRGMVPPPPGIFTGDYILNVDIAVNGPITRAPEDLDLLMDLIVQPEACDRKGWSIKLPPARKTKLSDFKIGLWIDDPACPVDTRILERIRRVVDALSNAGVKVEEKHPQVDFKKAFDLFASLLNAVMGMSAPPKVFQKWIAKESEMGNDAEEYQTRQIKGAIQRHRDWLMVDAERQLVRQKWAEYFEEFDIMLCPVTPVTAFTHDHGPWFERTIEVNGKTYPYANLMGWAGLTTAVYLPSTIAPIGISSQGLPIGLQIVAPYLEDKTSIKFAYLLKNLVGGFTPPPRCL